MLRKVIIVVFFFRSVLAWERNVTDFSSLFSLLLLPSKNEKDCSRSSQMTPLCKRPIWIKVATKQVELKDRFQHRGSIDLL